jgi:hypothetical protein
VKTTGIQQRQSTYFLLSGLTAAIKIFSSKTYAKTATALTTFKNNPVDI